MMSISAMWRRGHRAGKGKQAMKDMWDKIQVIFTVITALSAGIWGAFIYFNQRDINEKQQEISNRLQTLDRTIKSVDSMVPYIDKIVDKDPAKAKLSAYAIYILNKDNPNLAVSLISAVGKQELTDLLKEIGKTDPEVAKIISGLFPSPETAKPTQATTAATASREAILA